MHVDGLNDDDIRELLQTVRHIAVVGASAKAERASHHVMATLIDANYSIWPLNPGLAGQTILDRPVHAALDALAGPVDMVDVFRAADAVPQIVDEVIAAKSRLGIRCIWLQLGVVHEQAAARARHAGLTVVMDRCPAIERRRLGL